jgi:excisionase family DNA binding protein
MQQDNEFRFISPRQLQELLGCGRTFCYGLLARNEIPYYKVGRLRRIKVADAIRWLEANKYRPGE